MAVTGVASERRGKLIVLMLVSLVVALQTRHSGYQSCGAGCVPTTHNIAPPTRIEYLMSSDPCFVDGMSDDEDLTDPENTSVRAGQDNIWQGGYASVVGQYCVFRGCSGPNCVTNPPTNRNVMTIGLRQVSPTGSSTFFGLGNLNTPPYLQIIDSNSGQTNGPKVWDATMEGLYTYKTNVTTQATQCNIQPTLHPDVIDTVNVMACRPDWQTGAPPLDNVYVHPPISPTVTLNVPLRMDPARAAASNAAAWIEFQLGLVIDVTSGPPCTENTCINLSETDPIGTDCARTALAFNTTTGLIIAESTLRLPPPTSTSNWRNTRFDRLTVLIAHELLHYFGVGNRNHGTCNGTNTVMGPTPLPGCNSPDPMPSGALLSPSWSDTEIVQSGVRQQPPNRKRCGWGS
jgi:hypothetical protein